MTDLERFLRDTKVSSRIMQETIMHLDIREIALALSHASDFVRETFFANMTSGMRRRIEALHAFREAYLPQPSEAMQQQIREELEKCNALVGDTPTDYDRLHVKTDSEKSIEESICGISEFVRKYGLVALDETRETIDHPVMRKALEYFLDGWDQLLAKSLLEDFVTRHIEDERRKCRLMVEGMQAVHGGDLPDVARERMKALRTEL